jgi:uncharacterized protein (TIGR02594 family)
MLEARRLIGSKEIPGKVTAPFISTMLSKLGAWWSDDETPWCATFVSWCLQESQVLPPKAFYRAAAFKSWGFDIADYGQACTYGSVVVTRRPGGFHVAFLTGVDRINSRVQLLGGNQDNQVKFSTYRMDQVEAVRYPWTTEHWMTAERMPCPLWLSKPSTNPTRMV